jgi:hypothetical protein
MGLRRPPYAFTEHGVAMLSSVLRSKQAIAVSISIVRAFVRLRQVLASDAELSQRVAQHDHEIDILFEHIRALMAPTEPTDGPIGFEHPKGWRGK